MKQKVYSIYDSKVQAYLRPFYCRADGEALRVVIENARDINSPLAQHGADFTLFCIAEWDDDKGTFLVYDAHVNLGNALQIVSSEKGGM